MAAGAYEDRDFVFADQLGDPIAPETDRDEWLALLAAAQLDHARLHDGRHTAATLLLALGVDMRVVQELLGHSSIRVTEGYTHVTSKLARSATERMGRSLLRKPDTR